MIPSRETLVEAERRTQFPAPQLEIVIRLRDLLERMAADRSLADSLVLKGGTALNLCFGVPPRLSVDLDFNYIGAADRAVMLKARPDIVAALERLGRRAGYQVQRSAEDHAGQKFYFRYRSALGTAARLQVDINFLFRTPMLPVQNHPVWSPLDEASLETSVVGMGELMAGKMLALIDRSAARDLFDVARYAARTGLPALGTRDRLLFIALSGVLNHPLTNYTVERVQRVTDDAIETQLYPLLQGEDRPTVKDLWASAEPLVSRWLSLEENEREYTARLQRGELQPELLFHDDEQMATMLRNHPVLRWKAQNAAEHSKRDR